ncbi:MAG: lipoprotein 17-related variable surface protein [Treponema sp.]
MKTIVKKMLVPAGIWLTVLLIGCPQNNGFKPDMSAQPHLSEQQKLEAEVDKVILKVAGKTDITAGELKQENITASGYDSSYAIKYETIKGNSEDRKAEITFLLKKDRLISKKRTVTITGFKEKTSAPTGQELINAEADKVSVTVAGKETIFADELAANKNRITASGFDSAYTINYTVIKGDTAKREAEITFRLEKASLHSKTRTVTVTGFKEKVSAPDNADISEQELLKLFDLTETKIPASGAAKKIAAAQGKTVKNFVFEEANAIAYDDKTGTFTVKVKGLKNGKPFEKTISVTGFANPYELIFPSLSEAELDFSDAIENNTRFDAFIGQANTDITTVLKKLSFSDNNAGTLSLGTHERYSLAAALEKNGDKIKIRPEYKVKYLKKEAGGSETSTETDRSALFARLGADLTKPYFSKNDVFLHLIGKTDDNFLKVYPYAFASMYYAFTKHLNRTPGETGSLLDDAVIQDIIDRYKKAGGHFKMDIGASVYKPRLGGIKADDYTGSLEIEYCIAEKEQIEAMLDGGYIPYPIVAIKEAKRTGFKIVTKENAGTLFNFKIQLTADAQAQNAWKNKQLRNHPLLRAEYDSNLKKDVYKVNDPFKKAAYCTLKVNGKVPEEVLAFNEPIFFSKCADGADIFIEQISLNKESGSDKLKIHIQFTGEGEGISIEKQPE